MNYGNRSNGKQHGLVLTKPEVVNYMLNALGYRAEMDLRHLQVLEPSAGEGVFAVAILNTLHRSSKKYDFDFAKALSNLTFVELDEQVFDRLSTAVTACLQTLGYPLPKGLLVRDNFLEIELRPFDVVVGNPPYVRYEQIPDQEKNHYRKAFSTFTHRSDLYIPFFEKGLKLLKPGGKLSFICSNRWLKNQYGQSLRALIHRKYQLTEVLDLEGTTPFQEEVIAYPAIFNLTNGQGKHAPRYYQVNDLENLTEVPTRSVPFKTLYTHQTNWFNQLSLIKGYEEVLSPIEQQGFKIGIGVATGCDRVFIGQELPQKIEKEVLLPILTSKDLRNKAIEWSGNYVLNPFDTSGKLVNLESYPKAAQYLQEHSESLKARHIAIRNPRQWYKTIDKIDVKLVAEAKILLPDIARNDYILIDEGNYYPHHNLYYIKGRSLEDLTVLAAILMSDFAKDQLLEFGNKMNGGYPRWQSQNLRKLFVPIIEAIPEEIKSRLIEAYHQDEIDLINELITTDHIATFKTSVGQLALF